MASTTTNTRKWSPAYVTEACYKYNTRKLQDPFLRLHSGGNQPACTIGSGGVNKLYYGDCLTIMQEFPLASIDLIYLDPPFNSQRQYCAIYKDETGRPLPVQVEAFCDMWELNAETERTIRAMPVLMRESGIADEVAEFWRLWMNALRGTQPRLLAYLSYMVQRLLLMRRILKPTGSIYLHCDPTASHYIKALMDAIFGHNNFRNEIIWSYRRWPTPSRQFQSMHDVILFYSRDRNPTFNVSYEPPSASYVKRFKGKTQVLDPVTKTRKLVVDKPTKGLPQRAVWDISILAGSSKERMGYATQKPLALMERIIKASSNEGDTVLDPFCGCATTLEAAHKLKRKWIGIDIAIHAVKRVARVRLNERLGLVQDEDYEIEGVPRTVEGAQDLWERDKYHFQKWAVEQVDGFVSSKRTADGGIDGRLYFSVPDVDAEIAAKTSLESMIIEVKGGKNVGISVLRELKGVLEISGAKMAGLITLHKPGDAQQRSFNKIIGEAGDYEMLGILYPRLQVLSVEDILEGKGFHTPTVAGRHSPEPTMPGLPRFKQPGEKKGTLAEG